MFSQKSFIDVSRKFVCVRLESYENQEYHDLVRRFLNGRFANTAFCVLAPDGETRLTRSGRGPHDSLGGRGREPRDGVDVAAVVETLESIASDYEPQGRVEKTVPQDFHTFRQALNVASADQRLLVFAVAPKDGEEALRSKLGPIFARDDMIGLFHLDFAHPEDDAEWTEAVRGSSDQPGIYVIRAGQFGQDGVVYERLDLAEDSSSLRGSLLAANLGFSLSEERKDYASHVSSGRRNGIYFENAMPYGEDRDGDGEIDHVGGAGRSGKGPKGKRGGR